MTPLGDEILKTRRVLARACFWHPFCAWLGWGLLGGGVVVLFGKLIAAPVVLAAALALPVLPLIAALAAFRVRRRPTEVEAAVLLDRSGKLEGYPLLEQAFPENAWGSRSRDSAGGVPRLSPRAFLRALLPGALFLAAVFLLPQQRLLAGPPLTARDSAARREVQRLAEKLEKMEEKKTAPEEEIRKLKQELQSLDEATQTKTFDQAGWEGIDHLSEQLQKTHQESTAGLAKAAAAAGQAADALSKEGVDEAARKGDFEALQRALAGLPGAPLSPELQKMMQQEVAGGKPADSKKLQEAMRDLQESLDKQLQEVELNCEHAEGG